jgi:hypothetical protein
MTGWQVAGGLGLHALLGLFSIPALMYLGATASELGGGGGGRRGNGTQVCPTILCLENSVAEGP